jgi:hypothetical protein
MEGGVALANSGGGGASGVGSCVRLKPNLLRASVSLTMIVRDAESDLGRALESVRGVFDEFVVLDTGSRDRTQEAQR